MASDTKLTITAVAQGVSQAADDLQKLADAQGKVGEAGKQVGEQVQAAGKAEETAKSAIDGLSASHRDWLGLLRSIDPVLAEYARTLLHSVHVAGELANTNISLADAGKLASEGIGKLGGALGILGAAGLVFYGIDKLSDSIHKVKDEAEQARKALEDFHKAQTEIQRGPMESAAEIVAARDKEKRLKPFNAAQTESVQQTMAAAPESLRPDLGPILEVLGGAKGFGAGGNFRGSELEALARLGFKPREEASQGATEREARRFLAKRGGDFATVRERDRELRGAATESATQEAEHPDVTGGQANLRKIVEEQAKQFGVNSDLVQQEVEREMERDARRRAVPKAVSQIIPAAAAFAAEPELIEERPGEFPEAKIPGSDKTRKLTSQEVSAIDNVLRGLLEASHRMANAADKIADTPPTNTYSWPNQKNFGRDAGSFRARSVSGESRARAAEE